MNALQLYCKKNWKIFTLTFSVVFLSVTLQLLGVRPQNLLSPLPKTQDIFATLRVKLWQKKGTFTLRRSPSFIPQAFAANEYDQAPAYIGIDLDTGKVYAEKNASKQLPIASLTKVMTAVVSLDLANKDEEFPITINSLAIEPTRINVKVGEKLTLEELLDAALLTSANDAAKVIQVDIDQKYGEDVFIKAMNEKAKFLGLKNTHFQNPQGFDDPTHYSTAEDLAILSQYALTQYPEIAAIVKKDKEYLTPTSTHQAYNLYNWNSLIDVYSGAYGVKIGNTDDAGKTMIAAAKRNGKNKLVVVLGAPGILERDLWTASLLDAGFSEDGIQPINVTEKQLRAKYSTWK